MGRSRDIADILSKTELANTGNEALITTFDAVDSAYVSASKLQNPTLYPLVSQYIGRLRSEKIKKYDVTKESHYSELGQLRDEARQSIQTY